MPDYSAMPRFPHSSATIPRVFLVVPLLESRSHLSLHRVIRIIAPCQAPSITNGSDDSFHITAHRGYIIKYPKSFEHRHRDSIKSLTRATSHIVRGAETAASFAGNVSSHPGNLATSVLTSLHHKVENRARLNRAGIDPKNMFSTQHVTDSHQKKVMEELLHGAAASNGEHSITGDLKGIELGNGRTVWVCGRCHDCLQRGNLIDETNYLTLSEYSSLVQRESAVEVALRNSASVIVFTEAFTRQCKTDKMIIHIEPAYFEAPERAAGTRLNSIAHLFSDLGQVLQCQKVLTRLEINCNSTNSTNGEVYAGLQAVLKCSSLETLHVSGIPCFLQGDNITIRSRRLKELTLEGVLVDTEQAVNNLGSLIRINRSLTRLKVDRAGFTSQLLMTFFQEKPVVMRTQLARLEYLDLPCNDLGDQEKADFLSTLRAVLASDSPRPRSWQPEGRRRRLP